MSLEITIAGMVACAFVWIFAIWREKKQLLGDVAMIPYIYYKYSALIVFLVLAANFFSKITGIEWDPPMRR